MLLEDDLVDAFEVAEVVGTDAFVDLGSATGETERLIAGLVEDIED